MKWQKLSESTFAELWKPKVGTLKRIKIYKPLTRLDKKKERKIQIINIINESGDINRELS